MIDELEVFMANPVLHISFPSCEEVVNHSHLMAIHHQLVSQVGTHKTSPTCNLVEEYTCSTTLVKNILAITFVLFRVHFLEEQWKTALQPVPNTMGWGVLTIKKKYNFVFNYSWLRQQGSLNQYVFFIADNLTCHSKKSTGVTNNIYDDSILFKSPSKSWQ